MKRQPDNTMGLRDISTDGFTIKVKRMGEVDETPFIKAMLCSKMAETSMAWHPFKCVEVVDEEDEKLTNLREEWGEEVENAIRTALEELNEFNPSGRYMVPVV
ncbi:predicted protein [Arabidopsis lyrata subsp. lyrata]|uniref:Predicted protein n=1 Tax=Arabidopsis lyrata subsp. lyrata TaxID=81972 RepID=D7LP74_ARALL|nr:predicted protein [Arabidopsis lyrata subsp. lyrata]